MSGSYGSNPFADPEGSNPFADPAVQQASQNAANQGSLEQFNPFADNAGTVEKPPQPAVMSAIEQPPAYTHSAAQAATDDLQRRQEELERKAEELKRKEEEMRNMQNQQLRVNNFPPLPTKCCVQPCFYQDFNVDIPLEFQRIVKTVYYLWWGYVGLLFLNIVGTLAYLIASLSGSISNGSGLAFGLSLLFFFVFTPCSFVCWFRPLYKAFRSDSSFNFFVFFFIFFFQFIACVLQCLGFDQLGTCGFLNGLTMITHPGASAKAVGTIMLIVGLIFGLLALADMVVLIKVHRLYRSTGASFEKAQQEFAQGVMTNRTVQQTASNVATGAARTAVDQQFGNRY